MDTVAEFARGEFDELVASLQTECKNQANVLTGALREEINALVDLKFSALRSEIQDDNGVFTMESDTVIDFRGRLDTLESDIQDVFTMLDAKIESRISRLHNEFQYQLGRLHMAQQRDHNAIHNIEEAFAKLDRVFGWVLEKLKKLLGEDTPPEMGIVAPACADCEDNLDRV